MSPKKLAQLLAVSIRHRQKVLVVSEPGVGKSDIWEQAATEACAEFILCHPAVSDPTDYKGMPAVVADGTRAEFLPFGDLNRLIEATKLTVCVFDDLGQAPNSVQAALMQLLQARRINGHRISEHVVFGGATNDTTHMAAVSGIISPVKSRFDTIIPLHVDKDDWCAWAAAHNMPPELIAFIRFRPALLKEFKATRDLTNCPSPRTVASVGRWLNAGVRDFDVIAGAAGESFATEFTGYLKMYATLPSLDAILMDPTGAPVPDNPSANYAVASGLARAASTKNFERICRYLVRLEKEYEVCCVRDVTAMGNAQKKLIETGKLEVRAAQYVAVQTTAAYSAWMTKNADVFA